jgi:hypothetical protein
MMRMRLVLRLSVRLCSDNSDVCVLDLQRYLLERIHLASETVNRYDLRFKCEGMLYSTKFEWRAAVIK